MEIARYELILEEMLGPSLLGSAALTRRFVGKRWKAGFAFCVDTTLALAAGLLRSWLADTLFPARSPVTCGVSREEIGRRAASPDGSHRARFTTRELRSQHATRRRGQWRHRSSPRAR